MNTIPTVTKNLLIINVLMFLGTIVAQSYGIDLAQYLGLHFFLAEDFNAAQLITYMFMHAGFAHIFFNMFAVWMFGRILEQVWGPKRFLFYYLVCGIGAGKMFIFPLPVPIKAKYFVIGYALIELYAGFANSAGDNVAHFAHLGGMVFGFILIMYWRKKNRGNGYYYN